MAQEAPSNHIPWFYGTTIPCLAEVCTVISFWKQCRTILFELALGCLCPDLWTTGWPPEREEPLVGWREVPCIQKELWQSWVTSPFGNFPFHLLRTSTIMQPFSRLTLPCERVALCQSPLCHPQAPLPNSLVWYLAIWFGASTVSGGEWVWSWTLDPTWLNGAKVLKSIHALSRHFVDIASETGFFKSSFEGSMIVH